MTDKPPELLPIRLMEKNMPAKLAVQAMRQNKAITLNNGLKLNYNGKGSVGLDLKMSYDFDNQWAKDNPEAAAEYEVAMDKKYQHSDDN